MTTSPRTQSISDLVERETLSPHQVEYFRARLKNRIHDAVLAAFEAKARDGFTRADLARRLERRPEQVTRWLGAPGNWTIETVSDLLLAMGLELEPEVRPLGAWRGVNRRHELAADSGSTAPTNVVTRIRIEGAASNSVRVQTRPAVNVITRYGA